MASVRACSFPGQAFEEDAAASKGGRALPPNPLLLGASPEAYMLRQLASVRAGDLEQALLILPFSDALRLLAYFCTWLDRGAEVAFITPAVCSLLLYLTVWNHQHAPQLACSAPEA